MDPFSRYVFETDEFRLSYGELVRASPEPLPLGSHFFSEEAMRRVERIVGAPRADLNGRRAWFSELGPYLLATTPSGRDALRAVVAPDLAALVDELEPEDPPAAWVQRPEWTPAGAVVVGSAVFFRIDDTRGRLTGFCMLLKPAAGMSHLARAAVTVDLAHLERTAAVQRPDRRPAAILMADLEASSPLARHLSTAQYFAFGRRLVRVADRCIVDAGGIVGRHAGDGVVAFFLVDTAGSESAAASACITAARALRAGLADVAARSELATADLALRFGLHWGATLYVGWTLTRGRSEVTALGDEVNEAARIEACATGGRILASKSLIERLDGGDAEALQLDPGHTTYTPLSELATATDKARRDAPSIAVCEL